MRPTTRTERRGQDLEEREELRNAVRDNRPERRGQAYKRSRLAWSARIFYNARDQPPFTGGASNGRWDRRSTIPVVSPFI